MMLIKNVRETVSLSLFDPAELAAIEERIGYVFSNPALLVTALTSASSRVEVRGRVVIECQERLEFLGDRILGAAVSCHLYHRYPEEDEYFMTSVIQNLTSNRKLAEVAEGMDITSFIIVHKNLEHLIHRDPGNRKKVLSCTFEAIVAALFLDGGLSVVDAFLQRTLYDHIESAIEQFEAWKNRVPTQIATSA